MNIQGRIVLITGASSGIGAATARAMARKGGRVLLPPLHLPQRAPSAQP